MGRKRIDEIITKERVIAKDRVITKDRVGESVDLKKCPECAEHPDCFACMEGKCTALRESGGQGCVFYKSSDAELARCKESYRRLKEKGKNSLICKYIKPLSELGALDDEINEEDRISRRIEEFKAADYEKQLKASGIIDRVKYIV